MSNKKTKSKVPNAFRAMKAIGISEAKVKPVLKNLLKLYDKHWELIEEENYRVLADAIFEREEIEAQERSKKIVNTEAAEQSKKRLNAQAEDHSDEEAEATEEPERPLKRLRRRHCSGQTFSINTSNEGMVQTPLVQPKEEPDETIVPRTNRSMSTRKPPQPMGESATIQSPAVLYQSAGRDKGKQPVSAEPSTINERCDLPKPSSTSKGQGKTQVETDPRSHSHPMRLRERSAGFTSPQSSSMEMRPIPYSSAGALCLKEPKPEPDVLPSPDKNTSNHALITPKDEPVTDGMPCLDVPVVNRTDTSKGQKPLSNCGSEPLALQPLSENETADGEMILNQSSNGEPLMISGKCSSNIEITSSPSGEVKIFLNGDLARGRSDFKMPSLEAILKCVEDKYLRSPSGCDISLMNIMKEICQCFLEFGTNSHYQSQNTVDIIPPSDPSSKYLAPDGLVADDFCISSWNNLDVPRSSGKLPECQTHVPCRHNVNDGEQQTMNIGEEIAIDGENQESFVPETNALSLVVVQQPRLTPCNGVDEAVQTEDKNTPDDIVVNTVNPEKDTHETNCLSLETPQIPAPLHPAVDIAKGLENVVITLVNEVNDESPPSFYYIPQNAAFQNAYVNFFLARIGDKNCCASCSGDCLSSPTACACAHETGGKFAYTSDGLVKEKLLKECISMNRDPEKHYQYFCKECPLERSKCADNIEPCKGHLVRKFIKECWWKCGCNKQCGNRVVQRGISHNLQVFMTPGGKGWGLRTIEDLPKGAFVCEYVGEVLTNAELFQRVLKSPEGEKHSYPVLLDADWCAEAVLKDEDALCLDATYYGNVARFINHRCYDSNLVEIPVEVETPDHHYYHLAFFTTRKVKAMEELTWDYGIDFDDDEHPIKAFRCHCGSKFCRNIKRSSMYNNYTCRIMYLTAPNHQVHRRRIPEQQTMTLYFCVVGVN